MNDQLQGGGEDGDSHLLSDHELYRQIIAETVATVPCAIKTRAKTPKTKPLGEVRSDVVSVIASRAADFVCSQDNATLTQDARNLLVIKLTNDICNAFPVAQPKSGYTDAHFDTAKLIIPAFINHGHYSKHLRAYAKLCQIAQDPIDLGIVSLPQSYDDRDTHTLDNHIDGTTTTTSLADALQDHLGPPLPIEELKRRLSGMMDQINAHVPELFQDDKKPIHHNSREAVWHKLEILKTLKDSILEEAAARETRAPDAFGTPGHALKAYEWKLPPRGYAQMFLAGVNLAANPRSKPEDLEKVFAPGSKDRTELHDSLQQAEAEKRKIPGWRPEIQQPIFKTTFIGMHDDDIKAAHEIAITTHVNLHPDPEGQGKGQTDAQTEAVAVLRTSIIEAINSIECNSPRAQPKAAKPLTIGSMARRSKPLRESIDRFADSLMAMLHEPQFKELHIRSGSLALAKVASDLALTARSLQRSDAHSLSTPSLAREFLDEIAENIRNPQDDYGRYLRAYTVLCGDIRDPITLDGTYMVPESFAYADSNRQPLPFDGGDVSAPPGRGLPKTGHPGEADHPVGHEPEEDEASSPKGPSAGGASLYDEHMRTPILMLPRQELKRRLNTLMEHTRDHAFALFNISAPQLGKGSDIDQKLDILEQFKDTLYEASKREIEGSAQDARGNSIPRTHLFDPYWNITVQGYCNMFMHALELAHSRIKPEALKKELAPGSKFYEKMHATEAEAIATERARPDYEPEVTICGVRKLGTIHQPEMQRAQPVRLH